MFRPIPKATRLRHIPYRLITSVVLILALVVAVILLFSLEQEKLLLQGFTQGQTVATDLFPALWQSRHDLIVVTLLVFLVSAIGIAAVITFLHYDSTKRTLEEVKGLARNILESIPTGVLTINSGGQITAVNPSAVATLRRSTEELLGHSYDRMFPRGDLIRSALDEALHNNRHVDQHDIPYRTGDQARTIRLTTADLTGDDGRPVGVIALLKDVTELLDLERRVRVADKLAGLHTLSAGVAHELRNPLSAIDLNLHLLEEELRAGSRPSAALGKYLHVLNAETRRLGAILDNFMKFARPGALRLHAVDTGQVLSHIMALLQYEAQDRRIQLIAKTSAPLPSIMGDETEISQVLVNVIVNAFQAMPEGGVCHVIARGCKAGEKDWLELTVQDSGVGIREEELSRLFEPFYTTKTAGSGLGLAIAYRIVQDHGGTIQVSSTPGIGTTVVIKFPTAPVAHDLLVRDP
ncbi:two-component system sensor histidine kinase NtrB [Nitrospira sp. NS4]|uniref:two-component system sensor histidine kinase NtrB n=1 Tax=Nitrospira sp. NS4 TaxID=3414498 RepID=UPI003C302F12